MKPADLVGRVLGPVHVAFAVLAFGAFGATGLYMDRVLDHLRDMDLGVRMVYRSRHIYILMAALIHGGVGAYYRPVARLVWLQWIGSTLLIAATVGLLAAFVVDPNLPESRSPFSQLSIYGLAAGTALHLAAGLWSRRMDG